jgi:cyclase
MPLTYGGGISNLDQASQIFSLGVEKIALEFSAIHNHKFIHDLIQKYGSQAITTSISVKRSTFSKKYVYGYSNSSTKNVNFIDHLKKMVELGVGEILLTSIDFEGTQTGLDLRLLQMVKEIVPVPLIIHGGVGKISDILDGFLNGADAVGVGSYFVFNGPHKAVLISYLSKQEREFISTELGLHGKNL